ncbi:MAG: LEA type 2 family protein [Pseudomonadota bacterium]
MSFSKERRGVVCGLVCCVGLAGCAGIGDEALPPEVNLINIRPVEAQVFEQRFDVDLRIINPNDFDLDLDGLTFNLDVNGSRFASGVSNQAFTVPRLGETKTTVTASTSLFDIFQQFLTIAERTDLSYKISGLAYLNHFAKRRVPYEASGRLDFPPGLAPGRTLVPIAPQS